MKVEVGQIIGQILSFLIMFWVLNRFGWKPLLKVMKDRQDRIKAELDAIEEEKAANEKLAKDYQLKLDHIDELSQKKFSEALEIGRQKASEIELIAHTHAKMIISKAEMDAENEIQQAKAKLKNEIVNLAIEAAKKIIKVDLNEEKQRQIVLDFVNQKGL